MEAANWFAPTLPANYGFGLQWTDYREPLQRTVPGAMQPSKVRMCWITSSTCWSSWETQSTEPQPELRKRMNEYDNKSYSGAGQTVALMAREIGTHTKRAWPDHPANRTLQRNPRKRGSQGALCMDAESSKGIWGDTRRKCKDNKWKL